jgi:hypothetical protein
VAATQAALLKQMSIKDAFTKLDADLSKKFKEM